MSLSGASAEKGSSFAFRHIFVSISGIEVSSDAFQQIEIAPTLASKPAQIDLLASAAASDDSGQSWIPEAEIPPGDYTHVRLTLVSEAASGSLAPSENPCADVGVNCAIAFDGSIHPLVLNANVPEIYVASGKIEGGFFRVLPDTRTDLTIVFDAASSRAATEGQSLVLAPVFEVRSSSGAVPALNPNH